MNKQRAWELFALVVSFPPIRNALIWWAKKHPYRHLEGYMDRWWVFNPYDEATGKKRYFQWMPSVRVHHILREDKARHLHDHPWDARTIILKGFYRERKLTDYGEKHGQYYEHTATNYRGVGDTATILHGSYHAIDAVSQGGVWTLFITYKYRGTWGFLVNGKKVPWREYEEVYPST